MSRFSVVMCVLALGIVLASSSTKCLAQGGAGANEPQSEVVLNKLAQPFYPPLARATRVMGDVELTLEVRADGRVQSVVAISGHPLLKQAALDSARQSQFDCRKYDEAVTSVRLIYTFQLVGLGSCCAAKEDGSKNIQAGQVIPRVIQLQNHVTVVDEPVCMCDPGPDVRKVRSLKCLYIWKCATR